MNVVPIHSGVCRDSVAVLQHLLQEAQQGRVVGLAVCAHVPHQRVPEEITFTGTYRRHPSRGVNAAMRMSVRLAQLQDDMEAANR